MDKVIKWAAVAPPITAGALGWAMLIALLPVDLAGVGFIAAAGTLLMLASRSGERHAVRTLTGARPATNSELDALKPGAEAARQHGFTVQDLYLSAAASPEAAAPIGRRSIIVSPTLVARAHSGALDSDTVAVVLAHAEARRHTEGCPRFDIAGRLLSLPWVGVRGGARCASRVFGWIPGIRAFPFIATLVVAAAEWRTASSGLWWLTLVIAVFSSIVLGTPKVRRMHSARAAREADDLLARRGLGEALLRLLETSAICDSLVRIDRVRQSLNPPRPHLHLVRLSGKVTQEGRDALLGPSEGSASSEPNVSKSAVLLVEAPK